MQYKKSQSSLEFLIIFGIALSMIIILSGIFFSYSSEASSSLSKDQINKIGNEIILNIDKIYFLGSGNKITINTLFPDSINNISIYHMNISNGTGYNQFDYLNISQITSNSQIVSNIFTANENYIRFNCENCKNTTKVNGSWISYFNDTSDFSGGPKLIIIKSSDNFVYIDFDKG